MPEPFELLDVDGLAVDATHENTEHWLDSANHFACTNKYCSVFAECLCFPS